VRFGLAQVARVQSNIAPALEQALAQRPDPDPSFARRPSTASLILSDERRASQLPAWRLRTARAVMTAGGTLAIAAWTLTTGASYSLVSHFVHMRPETAVQTSRPEVGVLVDAPLSQLPKMARELSARGVHATFALDRAPSWAQWQMLFDYGDQAIPRLSGGGLVRWLGTSDQLHDLTSPMGFRRHFVYASSGPSVGQWWLAHHAGGRLIAGAIRLDDRDDAIGDLHPGEVVEISSTRNTVAIVTRLRRELASDHLVAVPVGRLMHDAGAPA
jgi:hypothetical protein